MAKLETHTLLSGILLAIAALAVILLTVVVPSWNKIPQPSPAKNKPCLNTEDCPQDMTCDDGQYCVKLPTQHKFPWGWIGTVMGATLLALFLLSATVVSRAPDDMKGEITKSLLFRTVICIFGLALIVWICYMVYKIRFPRTCPDGFVGAECQYSSQTTCYGSGKPDPDTGKCTCDDGFVGAECQYSSQATCYGYGKPDPDGKCICDDGFVGAQCQYSSQTCNGHGKPDPDNGNCTCDDGFVGAECQYSSQTTCNGHGKPDPDTGKCTCDDGYINSAGNFRGGGGLYVNYDVYQCRVNNNDTCYTLLPDSLGNPCSICNVICPECSPYHPASVTTAQCKNLSEPSDDGVLKDPLDIAALPRSATSADVELVPTVFRNSGWCRINMDCTH